MGLFGFKKKPEILDLTERYKKQQERIAEIKQDAQEDSQSPSQNAFSFLGNIASAKSSSESSSDYVDVSGAGEKRRKIAKRFMEMTTKIEDLSNQIYHLQQRLEVLEAKNRING